VDLAKLRGYALKERKRCKSITGFLRQIGGVSGIGH
jgi:hypothetical protein